MTSADPIVWRRYTLAGQDRLEISEIRQSYLDELRADVARHPGRLGVPCGQTAAEDYMDLHAWLLDIEAGMQAPPLTQDDTAHWDGCTIVRRTLAARS